MAGIECWVEIVSESLEIYSSKNPVESDTNLQYQDVGTETHQIRVWRLCVNWIFRFSHSRTELSCLVCSTEQRGNPTKLQNLLGENFEIQKFGCYFIKLQCDPRLDNSPKSIHKSTNVRLLWRFASAGSLTVQWTKFIDSPLSRAGQEEVVWNQIETYLSCSTQFFQLPSSWRISTKSNAWRKFTRKLFPVSESLWIFSTQKTTPPRL